MTPDFLYVTLQTRCNLRCEHCHVWKTENEPDFGNAKRLEVVEEFAELSPGGAVVTCGGEPMLNMDEYFDLTMKCKFLGLRCLSVTNGTHVTPGNAWRICADGPHEITVSLDSHDKAKHDKWRGVDGSWDAAVRALRLLLAARDGAKRHPKVFAMTIVAERSYRDLPELFDVVLGDLKADKLKLNMAQPTFNLVGIDNWFAENAIQDVDDLMAVIARCEEKWPLRIHPEWKRQVAMYFNSLKADVQLRRGWMSPGRTTEHICNTYDRNVMVDSKGTMRLCFSPGFPGRKFLAKGDLTDFWELATWRGQMAQCNRYCGISHSVRGQNATWGPE